MHMAQPQSNNIQNLCLQSLFKDLQTKIIYLHTAKPQHSKLHTTQPHVEQHPKNTYGTTSSFATRKMPMVQPSLQLNSKHAHGAAPNKVTFKNFL